MRKVYVKLDVRLIISADDGVDINEVLNEMEYDFIADTPGADIVGTEIKDQEILDSK